MPKFKLKHLHIPNLIQGAWREQDFKPFRTGIDICTVHNDNKLEQSSNLESQVSLLRYQAGSQVPKHRHTGVETILVLEGSQSDECGTYYEGSFIINPIGSVHSVWSEQGCVVLIQWERSVEFI